MNEIKNYKLKDFVIQDEQTIIDYVNLLQYVEPIPTTKEVFHLKLKHVDFIKEALTDNNDLMLIKIIALVQGITEIKVFEMPITLFFGLLNSVKEQIKIIAKAEQNTLASDIPNMKWESVNGSERMNKFGIYNVLDNLADGDILKYESILNLSYADVFTKLRMNKVKEDLTNEMNKIKTNV